MTRNLENLCKNKMREERILIANEIDKNIKSKLNEVLKDLIENQEEVISSPIRFNGVSIQKIEQIFTKYGINYEIGF